MGDKMKTGVVVGLIPSKPLRAIAKRERAERVIQKLEAVGATAVADALIDRAERAALRARTK